MDTKKQNALLQEFDDIAWKLSVEVPRYASRMREIVGEFRYWQYIEEQKKEIKDKEQEKESKLNS
jgi:hypothetical protein